MRISSIVAGLIASLLPGAITAAQEIPDIPFVQGGGEKQRLDLYLPDAGTGGAPVLLFVHGGSLQSGDRKEAPWPDVCRSFVAEGFVCAATSYRLFPEADWPAPAEDVAAAVGWLHANVAAHGGDPERIALLGHSSGCLLSTLVGSNPDLLAPHGLSPSDLLGVVAMGCRLGQSVPDTSGVPEERIAQAFAPGGPYERFGSLETLRSYHPMNYLGAHLPPFLVMIAEEERFKPPILDDAATWVGIARDCRTDADIEILADRTHMTAVEGLVSRDDPTFRSIVRFLERLTVEGPRTHLADLDRCPTG